MTNPEPFSYSHFDPAELRLLKAEANDEMISSSEEILRRTRQPGGLPVIGFPSIRGLGGRLRELRKNRANHDAVTPGMLRALLQNAGITGADALPFVKAYETGRIKRLLAKDLQIIYPVLIDSYNQLDSATIDSFQRLRARAYADITIENINLPTAEEKIEHAVRQLARQRDTFAWITDVSPGFTILGPTAPLCWLLGVTVDQLHGKSLISTEILEYFARVLDNFEEWILTIGLITNAQWNQLKSNPDAVRLFKDFFSELRQYATSEEASILAALDRVPEASEIAATASDLKLCLRAAQGKVPWPAYEPDQNNKMRIWFRLPNGQIARLKKVAMPIWRAEEVIGYEVRWDPDYFDSAAVAAMRRALDLTNIKSAGTRDPIAGAMQQLANSDTEIGWLIDEVRGQVLAASDLWCDVMQTSRSEIVGKSVLSDWITDRFRAMGANFEETVLIEAALMHSLVERLQLALDAPLRSQADSFIESIRSEFASEARRDEVKARLDRSPIAVDGRPYRSMLFSVLDSIVDGKPWPEFDENSLNFMPLIIGTHRLLTGREQAHFRKTATFIGNDRPTAVLVRFIPAADDEVASKFVRTLIEERRRATN